jgi:hypothetical protein
MARKLTTVMVARAAHSKLRSPLAGTTGRQRTASGTEKPASKIDDNTFVMADGTNGHHTSEGSCAGIVGSPLFPHEAEKFAEKLSTGTWTHDYPIFAAKAKELGPVSTDMPNEVRTAIANIRATTHDRLFRATKGVMPRS